MAAVEELLCGGLGVCWIAQDFPFQRSARVTVAACRLRSTSPTAVQATGEEQEIPFREGSSVRGGPGRRWMTHAFPFHRSARAKALK